MQESIKRNDIAAKNAEKMKKMEEARIARLKKLGKSVTRELIKVAMD